MKKSSLALAPNELLMRCDDVERVIKRIHRAEIQFLPFPHIVVRGVLPWGCYDRLIDICPSAEQWEIVRKRDDNPDRQPDMALRDGSPSSFYYGEHPSWHQYRNLFKLIDLALLARFQEEITRYLWRMHLLKLVDHPSGIFTDLDQAMLCQRDASWRIQPHVHDLTEIVQSMLYMPLSKDESENNGTLLYRPCKTRSIWNWNEMFSGFGRVGGAVLAFDEDEVEAVAELPYEPNTLVAFLNTPASIHASPVTNIKRRYVFSQSILRPIGDNPLSCGERTAEVDYLELVEHLSE